MIRKRGGREITVTIMKIPHNKWKIRRVKGTKPMTPLPLGKCIAFGQGDKKT